MKHLGYPIIGDPLYQTDEDRYKPVFDTINAERIRVMEERLKEIKDEEDVSDVVLCPDCLVPTPDLKKEELYLCLHALRYESKDWSFIAPPPFWADIDISTVNTDSPE